MVLHQAINSVTDILGPSVPVSDLVVFQWLFNAGYVPIAVMLVVVFGPARVSLLPASESSSTADRRRQPDTLQAGNAPTVSLHPR
jgi:hypothetical protein